MLRVGLIGFGVIARVAHLKALLKLQEEGLAQLVAVSDLRIEDFRTELSDAVHTYTDWREMLEKETLDFVDICLPTFLHKEVTVTALGMGYPVLCEKPMSLTDEACAEMIAAAKAADRQLMIAQCLRFDPYYNFLKEAIQNNTFGAAKSGIFYRMSDPPFNPYAETKNWFMDYEKTHGCIADMHVHDVDMVRYLFGQPESVSCCTQDIYSKKDIAHSTLRYPGFSMLALGDWSQTGVPCAIGYRVAFEKATVDYSNNALTVYMRTGETYNPGIQKENIYYNEIRYFMEGITTGAENTVNPPEESANTIALINKLIYSSDNNGAVVETKI